MKWLASGLMLAAAIVAVGCGKKETQQAAQPATPPAANEAAAPAEEPATPEKPAEAESATPAAPAAPQSAQDEPAADNIKTAARPSLLLELLIEPVTYAMQSNMEAMQAAAKPIFGGGIPGLPRPAANGDDAAASEPAAEQPAPEQPTDEPKVDEGEAKADDAEPKPE